MLSLISGWPYIEFFIFNIIKAWKNSRPELLVAYIQSKLISDDHIQGLHCTSVKNLSILVHIHTYWTELSIAFHTFVGSSAHLVHTHMHGHCLFQLVLPMAKKNKAHKANDASSWWRNDCMTTWLLKDQLTIRPSYRDAKMHLEGLVFLLWPYLTRKCWFSLFLTKAWGKEWVRMT